MLVSAVYQSESAIHIHVSPYLLTFMFLKHVYKYILKEIHIEEHLQHLRQHTFIGPVTDLTPTPECGSAL